MSLIGEKLLGLPLSQALSLCGEQGIDPVVLRTKAPRDEYGNGEERVLAYRPESKTLVVAAFHAAVPRSRLIDDNPSKE